MGDASIATADQPHEPSAAAAAKAARTAATELQRHVRFKKAGGLMFNPPKAMPLPIFSCSEVNALRAENAQLRRAQEADERVRAELADRIEGLESEVADLHDRKEEEVQELRAVVRALEGQLERLQVDLKEGDGMVARLEKATRVLRREAEAKAQALRQAKQEVLALQQANDELETRLLASVRPSPPRMLGSPAAAVTTAAAAFVTPEAPSAHAESTTTTAKALQEANAALRQRVVTAAKAHAQMWNAGEQLAAELLEAKGQAHFWKREALLWRDEVATRAAGESDGDGDGHTRGEVARLKSKYVSFETSIDESKPLFIIAPPSNTSKTGLSECCAGRSGCAPCGRSMNGRGSRFVSTGAAESEWQQRSFH